MEEVRGFAHHIFKKLGPGYNECVYHRALEVLLRQKGLAYETERIVPIVFEEHTIGNLRIDLIVNGDIIVELKAVAKINEAAKIQANNYLNLTGFNQAMIINFPQSQSLVEPEVLILERQI